MGTRRLYALLDGDPRFAFHPIEYICDPTVIAAKGQMVSVAQAFTIDLTGKVSTETLDGALYGGVTDAGSMS
jgi:acyl-CoA hydrolase